MQEKKKKKDFLDFFHINRNVGGSLPYCKTFKVLPHLPHGSAHGTTSDHPWDCKLLEGNHYHSSSHCSSGLEKSFCNVQQPLV